MLCYPELTNKQTKTLLLTIYGLRVFKTTKLSSHRVSWGLTIFWRTIFKGSFVKKRLYFPWRTFFTHMCELF